MNKKRTLCIVVTCMSALYFCSALRNPFAFGAVHDRASVFCLRGIICCDGKLAALLDTGHETVMVKKGDVVEGYTVIECDQKHIVIEKDGRKKRVSMP